MSPLHWTKANSVGNASIDQQHLEWINIFNKLEETILSPAPFPTAARVELFHRILEFTSLHFQAEEEVMARHNYPDIVRHRRMHREFEQIVYEQYRLITDGEIVLTSELLSMIKNWFIQHTQGEDIRTFRYINGQNAGTAPAATNANPSSTNC